MYIIALFTNKIIITSMLSQCCNIVVHFVRLYSCTRCDVCQCSLHWATQTCLFDSSCCGTKVYGLHKINCEKIVMRLWHSIAGANIVYISLSIRLSELHERASPYVYCSLLWYEKGIVYQQIITTVVSNHQTLLLYHVSCM